MDQSGGFSRKGRKLLVDDQLREAWLHDGSYCERWVHGFDKRLYHGRTQGYFRSDLTADTPYEDWTKPTIIEGDNPLESAPFNDAVRLRNTIDGTTADPLYFATPKAHHRMKIMFQAKFPSGLGANTFLGVVVEVNSSGYLHYAGLHNNGGTWELAARGHHGKLSSAVTIRHEDKYARYALIYNPPYLELWQAPAADNTGTTLERTEILDMRDLEGKGIVCFFNENEVDVEEWRLGNFWIVEMNPYTYFETILKGAARTASGTSDSVLAGRMKHGIIYLDITAVSGTSPTLDIDIEGYNPAGDDWHVLDSFAQKTGTGTDFKRLTEPFSRTLRIAYTIGGTNPSFTFSVAGEFKR